MYSVVLAAMLTAGPAVAPAWGHGCNGCCGGANAFSTCCGGCCGGYSHGCCGGYSYSCCGGCCGSYSYGCCGGCCGGYSYGCCGGYSYGCCGGYSYGCYGGYSYGCCGGYSSCFGCCGYSSYSSYYGCCGGSRAYPIYSNGSYGGVIVEPAVTAPVMPSLAAPKKETSAAAPATVIVKAPLDVHITVNGLPAERTKVEQVFSTPSLDAGRTYSYEFRAEATRDGKTLTRTQKVIVKAGQESKADFNDLAAADGPAHVTITAPADARVTVDGVEIPAAARAFNTPNLEAGRQYSYTVKMTMTRDGRAVNDSKRVVLEAGKDVTVEFKEPAVTTAGK